MASYITETNARARLKDQFDDFFDLNTAPQDFNDDVAAAEGEVNSLVGRRYVLPVSTEEALAVCTALALDLFAERAWMRAEAGSEIPEKIKDMAAIARKRLEQISKGISSFIGAAQQSAPGGAATALAISTGDEPQMTSAKLQGF